MDFTEAIKLLREGKKVRREGSGLHLYEEGEEIKWSDGGKFAPTFIEWYLTTDWEEYKEVEEEYKRIKCPNCEKSFIWRKSKK